LRVIAAQIVYMPTFAPQSSRISPAPKPAIHSRVHGSLVRIEFTRHNVSIDGVTKRIVMPSCSMALAGTSFSYCSSVSCCRGFMAAIRSSLSHEANVFRR
jgi:hypothetical protein